MLNFDWAKRTHKGLRRWVLYIVRDQPMSGAQIMDFMEANLQGWWRPSPGSIYPLLDNMAKEGLLSKSPDKRYSLTQQGREELEHPFPFMRSAPTTGPRSVEEVLGELTSYVSYLEDIARVKDGRLATFTPQLRELGERLNKLGESA